MLAAMVLDLMIMRSCGSQSPYEILDEAFHKLNRTPDQRESLKRLGSNLGQLLVDASGQHFLVVGSACSSFGMDMIVLNVYADWVNELAGLQLVVKHAFSCENNKLKHMWLLTLPHPPELLFCQCQRSGSRRWGHCQKQL